MLVSLTVGKVDAGVTVLLTQDKRLIEFPSILLPPNITSGSIVDITVGRNHASESKAEQAFHDLQNRIYATFGAQEPSSPVLRCRNTTQTSVVLEWDPIHLATADLISLSLYRNGQKAGNIPRPLDMHSTKISGLAIDTEYTFHLVLRTTAGVYASDRVPIRTHKLTDLSGVTIATGILPSPARDALAAAVDRIGAKLVDAVRIDTTHFVTTEGRGLAWEKAVENNIPVVRPEWVDACEKNGRIIGVSKFYLDAWRPGPPTTTTTTTTTTATAAPGPDPAARSTSSSQKDLPAAPPQQPQQQQDEPPPQEQAPSTENSETAPAANDSAPAAAPSRGSFSGSEKPDDDDDDDGHGGNKNESDKVKDKDEDTETEQKTRGPEGQEEQKVRLEDKDDHGQNLALRPGGALSAAVGDDAKGEDDGPVSSSRGSLQDVEL